MRYLNKATVVRASKEVGDTVLHPTRLRHVASREKWAELVKPFRRMGQRPPGTWSEDGGWGRRSYESYDEYLAHQASKLEVVNLDHYEPTYEAVLAERLESFDLDLAARPVLCLAARLGAEVRAFQRHGAFAVGIDLNPGPDNPHVLVGDFHALRFPDRSTAVVFTNALDHALEVEKVVAEAHRVLADDGHLLVEACFGHEDLPDAVEGWMATWWPTLDDLIGRISEVGFECTVRHDFDYPWPGQALLFAKRPAAAPD